jgi:hypothetical protein
VQKEKDTSFKKQLPQQSLNEQQKMLNDSKTDLGKFANILLKPENTDNYLPNALLEKKRKKKKKYLSI